jgi:hypothetical protein
MLVPYLLSPLDCHPEGTVREVKGESKDLRLHFARVPIFGLSVLSLGLTIKLWMQLCELTPASKK